MLRLFWHAWRKHRPEIALEFGLGQGALRHVHDLVGMGTPALYERMYPRARAPSPSPGQSDAQRLPAAALGYYSGLVAQRREDARRVGKEGDRTGRSRGWTSH